MKRFLLEYKHARISVLCDRTLQKEAQGELERIYREIERYIEREPLFLTVYEPVEFNRANKIVQRMIDSGKKAGVGPMASVAGTISELLGEFLSDNGSEEFIVENGGDIYLKLKSERIVGIYAGDSRFSRRIGFRIKPEDTPVGVCTSSGSVGHSVSLGSSDSVTVIAESCPLADAAATSIANEVSGKRAIEKGIKRAKKIPEIQGALIIKGGEMGTYGRIPELCRI